MSNPNWTNALNPNWTDEECHQATLEYLKGMGYRGDDLPPFLDGPRASSCPVANALRRVGYHDVEVGYWEVDACEWEDGEAIVRSWILPTKVTDFILRADAGRYPDLPPTPFKS